MTGSAAHHQLPPLKGRSSHLATVHRPVGAVWSPDNTAPSFVTIGSPSGLPSRIAPSSSFDHNPFPGQKSGFAGLGSNPPTGPSTFSNPEIFNPAALMPKQNSFPDPNRPFQTGDGPLLAPLATNDPAVGAERDPHKQQNDFFDFFKRRADDTNEDSFPNKQPDAAPSPSLLFPAAVTPTPIAFPQLPAMFPSVSSSRDNDAAKRRSSFEEKENLSSFAYLTIPPMPDITLPQPPTSDDQQDSSNKRENPFNSPASRKSGDGEESPFGWSSYSNSEWSLNGNGAARPRVKLERTSWSHDDKDDWPSPGSTWADLQI